MMDYSLRKFFPPIRYLLPLKRQSPNSEIGLFPPNITLFAFLSQALSNDKSLRDAVARVNADRIAAGKKPVSSNTASFCNARLELPVELPQQLFYSVALQLEDISKKNIGVEKGLFKGRKVKLVDGSTLLMPDTPENQKQFPQMTSQKKGSGFPIARVAAVFSLFTGAIFDLAIGPYKGKATGEHALIRQLFHCFEKGDIVLGDAYYASYFLMAMLQSMGIDFVFESHGARKSDYRLGVRLAKKDHLITLEKPLQPDWMPDELYALMPEKMQLREFCITIDRPGFKSRKLSITTSFFDAKENSREELGSLYACRWAVELNLRDIKTTMHMDMLRCKTPDMVKKEIWVHLLAYNVIRKIMLQAAIKKGLLPWQISFKASIQTLNHYSTLWRDKLIDKDLVYEYMLNAIGSQIVGNRPGRSEPRKRKRRAKPFPLLHGKRKSKKIKIEATRVNLQKHQSANEAKPRSVKVTGLS